MSHRLFGTDGVRGKAGDYPLDHETVARLGAALVRAMAVDATRRGAAAISRRPRHPRVRRMDRARARARRASAGGGDHDRRRHPDAGGRLPDARDGLRRRARDLRVAQSVRGQRHQGVLGRGEKFTETLEREVEAIIPTGAGRSPGRRMRRSTDTERDRRVHRALRAWRCPIRSALGAFKLAIDTRERRDDDGGAAAVRAARLRRRS